VHQKRLIDTDYGPPSGDNWKVKAPSTAAAVVDADSSENEGEDDADEADDDDDDDDEDVAPMLDSVGRVIFKIPKAKHGSPHLKFSECNPDEDFGNANPSQKKRHAFLSPAYGVNDFTWGMLSMAFGPNDIHVQLVKKLETRAAPISHLARRWTELYIGQLQQVAAPATFEPACEAWRTAMSATGLAGGYPKTELVSTMDTLLADFVKALISGVKSRIEPYCDMLCAYEMADPRTPMTEYTEAHWKACEDLCNECGMSFAAVKRELNQVHNAYETVWRLNVSCTRTMRVNLLRFYNDEVEGLLKPYPDAVEYARHVFEKPVTSVAIECMFSTMKYNQSSKRPNLADATTAAIVKAQNLTDPVEDPMAPKTPTIDWHAALRHELPATHQV